MSDEQFTVNDLEIVERYLKRELSETKRMGQEEYARNPESVFVQGWQNSISGIETLLNGLYSEVAMTARRNALNGVSK